MDRSDSVPISAGEPGVKADHPSPATSAGHRQTHQSGTLSPTRLLSPATIGLTH